MINLIRKLPKNSTKTKNQNKKKKLNFSRIKNVPFNHKIKHFTTQLRSEFEYKKKIDLHHILQRTEGTISSP